MSYLRIFRLVSVSCFAAILAAEAYFGEFLIRNRSTTASIAYNIPFAAHGPPVFISNWDYNLYYGLFYSAFVLLAICAALYLVGKNKQQ
jgi:hypothetical protein